MYRTITSRKLLLPMCNLGRNGNNGYHSKVKYVVSIRLNKTGLRFNNSLIQNHKMSHNQPCHTIETITVSVGLILTILFRELPTFINQHKLYLTLARQV